MILGKHQGKVVDPVAEPNKAFLSERPACSTWLAVFQKLALTNFEILNFAYQSSLSP